MELWDLKVVIFNKNAFLSKITSLRSHSSTPFEAGTQNFIRWVFNSKSTLSVNFIKIREAFFSMSSRHGLKLFFCLIIFWVSIWTWKEHFEGVIRWKTQKIHCLVLPFLYLEESAQTYIIQIADSYAFVFHRIGACLAISTVFPSSACIFSPLYHQIVDPCVSPSHLQPSSLHQSWQQVLFVIESD